MEESTSNLFTVQCNCGNIFPAENGKCSCGNTIGELKLNVDSFLDRLYNITKIPDKLDLIYDVYFHLYDRFDIMNDILDKIDVIKISGSEMCAFLSETFKYIKQVPNHLIFLKKCEIRLREIDYDENRIENIFKGFRETGNYWKNMETLGAPTWLTGPKPE